MNQTPIRRATFWLASLATLLVAFAIPPETARAADFNAQVRQGESIMLLPFTQPVTISVSPAIAGIASHDWAYTGPSSGTETGLVTFKASASYLGLATVTISRGAGSPTTFELNVVGGTAAASGSFVPVAAPGPCLLVTVNPIVDFGEITLGSPGSAFKTTPAPPNIAGCAVGNVVQDVLISASNAQNGPTSLGVDGCGTFLACVAGVPGTGSYAVAVPSVTRITGETQKNLMVASAPSTLLTDESGAFSTVAVGLGVKLPSQLDQGALGTIFTFDVTFTAVSS